MSVDNSDPFSHQRGMSSPSSPWPDDIFHTESHGKDVDIALYSPERSETTEPLAQPSAPLPPGPVDGGLLCWLQVLGSFIIWTNTWGSSNSFGVGTNPLGVCI